MDVVVALVGAWISIAAALYVALCEDSPDAPTRPAGLFGASNRRTTGRFGADSGRCLAKRAACERVELDDRLNRERAELDDRLNRERAEMERATRELSRRWCCEPRSGGRRE